MYKGRMERKETRRIFRARFLTFVSLCGISFLLSGFQVSAKEIANKKVTAEFFTLEEPKPVIYLTFDDGPSKDNTDAVLDALKAENVKATFFVIGEYVRKYPETAKRIAEEGHTIGIHCDVHDYDVLYESVDSYVADFEKACDTVYEIMGVKTKLFRFPGGSVNAYNKGVCDDIIEEMTKRGFVYFDWNASLQDASGKKTEPSQLIKNAKETAMGRDKVVLLAHDRVENTALCLSDLLDAFPEYQFKTLNLSVKPVQFKSPKQPQFSADRKNCK